MKDFKFAIGEGTNTAEALASLQTGIIQNYTDKPYHLQQIFICLEARATVNLSAQPTVVYNAIGLMVADDEPGTTKEGDAATLALTPQSDFIVAKKYCEGHDHDWGYEKVLDGNDREVLGIYRRVCKRCKFTDVQHGAIPG